MPRRRKTPLPTASDRSVAPTTSTTSPSAKAAMSSGSKPIYFWGHGAKNPLNYMSQWYISEFTVDGQTFNCCEQWMMWSKAMLFGDNETAVAVLASKDPKEQKALGRTAANFNPTRWDEEKSRIVETGNYHKFSQGKKHDTHGKSLRQLLLETGESELVEASPHDRIWGIGFTAEKAEQVDREAWGENLLGKALMAARTRLREADGTNGL